MYAYAYILTGTALPLLYLSYHMYVSQTTKEQSSHVEANLRQYLVRYTAYDNLLALPGWCTTVRDMSEFCPAMCCALTAVALVSDLD